MSKKVVVIEDDRDILDLIRYILADEGYEVTGYRHLEPLEKVIAENPSVILLDDRLEDGYGNTLCTLLKSDEKAKNIPVILVSASRGLPQLAIKCHADAFLPKPFNLVDLVDLVKRYSESTLQSAD
jgi:DNA-binding response OmpR family regulator